MISKAKKRLEGVQDEHSRFVRHVELQHQDWVCSFLLLVLIVVIVDTDLPRSRCAHSVGSFLSVRMRHVFRGRVCGGIGG